MRFDLVGAIPRGRRGASFWFVALFVTIGNRATAQDGESLASSFFSGKIDQKANRRKRIENFEKILIPILGGDLYSRIKKKLPEKNRKFGF